MCQVSAENQTRFRFCFRAPRGLLPTTHFYVGSLPGAYNSQYKNMHKISQKKQTFDTEAPHLPRCQHVERILSRTSNWLTRARNSSFGFRFRVQVLTHESVQVLIFWCASLQFSIESQFLDWWRYLCGGSVDGGRRWLCCYTRKRTLHPSHFFTTHSNETTRLGHYISRAAWYRSLSGYPSAGLRKGSFSIDVCSCLVQSVSVPVPRAQRSGQRSKRFIP